MIKDIRSIGATAFNAAESFEPANWFPISIQIPTGGVIRPIHRLKDITIPNWMVSMPNAFIKGSSRGVIITIAAFASINIPIIKNRILMSNRMTMGLSVKDAKPLRMVSGRPETVTT